MKKVIVVGVGNILFMDEGVGIYAAKYIEQNYILPQNLEVIDGGTLGFQLMSYYQEYDKVIILDTVSISDDAGSIYNLPAQELLGLGSYRQTAHEVEVVEMLEICSMLDRMAEVSIIGIVPDDIQQVRIDLSDAIKEKFDFFINEIIKEIQKETTPLQKQPTSQTLQNIIESYAHPSVDEEYKC